MTQTQFKYGEKKNRAGSSGHAYDVLVGDVVQGEVRYVQVYGRTRKAGMAAMHEPMVWLAVSHHGYSVPGRHRTRKAATLALLEELDMYGFA